MRGSAIYLVLYVCLGSVSGDHRSAATKGGHEHDVRIAVCLEALLAPFAPDTGFLVPAEEGLRRRLLPRVDEDGAGLQTLADALGALDVRAPDASPEAGVGVVCATDDFFLVGPETNR